MSLFQSVLIEGFHCRVCLCKVVFLFHVMNSWPHFTHTHTHTHAHTHAHAHTHTQPDSRGNITQANTRTNRSCCTERPFPPNYPPGPFPTHHFYSNQACRWNKVIVYTPLISVCVGFLGGDYNRLSLSLSSRLVAKFNHSHTVNDVRQYINLYPLHAIMVSMTTTY